MIHGWTPQISDPSVLGWLTVASYFFASLLCLRAAGHDASAKNLWRALGLALIALGINKQLDLQTLLTQVGREYARSGRWYEHRRAVQQIFISVIAFTSILGSMVVIVMFKNRSRGFRMASIGLVLLAAFVCIRAASFHHVDRFLNLFFLGARFNWLIELGGIAVIVFAAVQTCRAGPGSSPLEG